ncbi:MAG: CDP-glucose 4,6-dehydratase [Actinobacteria bacterium]|nr:CDP-glucose 4,6-dehydratase [Actinomycetota bacterium]
MRYLITGHTGFKGAWLTLWLTSQGHEVCGLALDPEPGSLFETADIGELCAMDVRGDIRDASIVATSLKDASPDVVLHLAAQPLVPESYRRPRWTMETNVMGTLNLLEAVGGQASIQALVVVTTDKVYRNVSQREGYTESDALGGNDPYSASKAMADILTHSWATSFGGPPTAIARAGNVIGGGDISQDRLIPDLVKSLRKDEAPRLRYPDAVRPWQHVLDCLGGYIALADALVTGTVDGAAGDAWNFGPDVDSFVTVGEVASRASRYWGASGSWGGVGGEVLHEAGLLALDSTKAQLTLGWHNKLSFDNALAWTLDWYKAFHTGASARELTRQQISDFSRFASSGVST